MNLAPQSIQLLRDIVNEKSQYRSGPQLVDFFNQLGFSDSYGRGSYGKRRLSGSISISVSKPDLSF